MQHTRPIMRDVIPVPDVLLGSIDQLVERMSRRTGESPAAVRRAVELGILQRGIRELQGELAP